MIGLLRKLHRKHGRLIEQVQDALKKLSFSFSRFVHAFSTLFANVSLLLWNGIDASERFVKS
jgi:hypothetical protein